MTHHMKLTDAKARLSEVVNDVHSTHEEIHITRNGLPVAVLISYDELESLRETLEILSDPEIMAQLHENKEAHARGEDAQPATKEELLAEIRAAAHARALAKASGE